MLAWIVLITWVVALTLYIWKFSKRIFDRPGIHRIMSMILALFLAGGLVAFIVPPAFELLVALFIAVCGDLLFFYIAMTQDSRMRRGFSNWYLDCGGS